jgi:hypothetical protein
LFPAGLAFFSSSSSSLFLRRSTRWRNIVGSLGSPTPCWA